MQGQAPRTNNGTPLEITLHRRLQLQLQLKRAFWLVWWKTQTDSCWTVWRCLQAPCTLKPPLAMADWDYLQLYWCWNAKDKLRWKLVTWVLIWYFGVWRTETKGMVWRCPIPHPSKWLAGDCPRCSMVDHLMSTPWRVVRRERHRQLSQNIDAKRGEFFWYLSSCTGG